MTGVLHPFEGYVVAAASAAAVVAPAYDTLTAAQRAAVAAAEPDNYLNVLPAQTGHDEPPGLLESCRDRLQSLIAAGHFVPLPGPSLGVYRLRDGDHEQTGVVVDVAVRALDDRLVLPHERTDDDRVDQLVRYLEVVGVNSSPVSLVHRADRRVDASVAATTAEPAYASFTAGDDVQQTVWLVTDPALVGATLAALAQAGPLVIADGHHRWAAARRFAHRRAAADPDGPAGRILATLFPADQVRVRAYRTDQLGPPPTVELVLQTAAAGGTMPPKSTYFAPKTRSGVFVRPRSLSC